MNMSVLSGREPHDPDQPARGARSEPLINADTSVAVTSMLHGENALLDELICNLDRTALQILCRDLTTCACGALQALAETCGVEPIGLWTRVCAANAAGPVNR